jgi:hypothetical protein
MIFNKRPVNIENDVSNALVELFVSNLLQRNKKKVNNAGMRKK